MKEYLAYVVPIEEIVGKKFVNCNIYIVTGNLNHSIYKNIQIETKYFTYYFSGAAFEVLELYEDGSLNIRDITKEDAKKFKLSLKTAVTVNSKTHDILGTDNFVYNMKQNKLYNECPNIINNLCKQMTTLDRFVLRLYTINGTLIYLELDTKEKNGVVLTPGFVSSDKNTLKCLNSYIVGSNNNSNEKLKQEDIDKLITRLIS